MRTRFRVIIWFGVVVGSLAGLSSCTPVKPAVVDGDLPVKSALPILTEPTSSPTSQPAGFQTTPAQPELTQTETPFTAPVLQITPTFFPAIGPALAFLKNGDIWLLDGPGTEPYPLTIAGDILGFSWTPDGERLIAYNGGSLCFYHRDGSIRTACLELGLNAVQALVERRLVISPDQRWVVLWNPSMPQESEEIGWIVVALDTSNIMYRIQDPVDWGATFGESITPGGFTGQPAFLADGRLLGTLSHSALCANSNCNYSLFEFDLIDHQFNSIEPKSGSEFSFGSGLTLVGGGLTVANVVQTIQSCEVFASSVNLVNFQPESIKTFPMDGLLIQDISFNPDLNLAVFSNFLACKNDSEPVLWQDACGLASEYQVLPIQLWDINSSTRQDLFPGLKPEFSPDGLWVTFLSCLQQDDSGAWQPGESSPPNFYLYNIEGETLQQIADGIYYEWRP